MRIISLLMSASIFVNQSELLDIYWARGITYIELYNEKFEYMHGTMGGAIGRVY